ncbi:MAG: hypothetical protein IMX02_03235 [Limnochordaceae bacterium]|nr:hypothetical protein [Limnochordaceae bacterium]
MDQAIAAVEAFLALDLGTSGCRAAAFDVRGRVLASARQEYPTYSPRPGWAEQDPSEWEDAAVAVLHRVAAAAGGRSGRIEFASLTLTGQMAGLVLIGRDGRTLYPAIPWHDRRAQAQASLLDVAVPEFYRITGCHASPVYPVAKFLWLRRRPKAGSRGSRRSPFDGRSARPAGSSRPGTSSSGA